MITVPLHEIAHGRAGDKGNRLNISVVPYVPEAWHRLGQLLSEERVLELFRHRGATAVRRYDLPLLKAYNFVIDDVLEGGVNTALNLDGHGKTLSFLLLSMPVEVDPAFLARGSAWRSDAGRDDHGAVHETSGMERATRRPAPTPPLLGDTAGAGRKADADGS